MTSKPLIFVTNDDGYKAKGINLLCGMLRKWGKVVMVAPEEEMSGKSHSISSNGALTIKTINKEEDFEIYCVNGTPVDCVKLGFDRILGRVPDFLFSGINHGSNVSINTIYSGTMGAAMEGCSEGVPSVGLSLCDTDKDASFTECTPWIEKICEDVIKNGLEDGICLNVNLPKGKIKALRAAHQAKGYWKESFESSGNDLDGEIYWLSGEYVCLDDSEEADYNLIHNGYGAVVPMQVDFTAWDRIEKTKDRFNIM